MRILTVTTFFPNPVDPQRAVFVRHLVQAMESARPGLMAGVLAPVPWAPPRPRRAAWQALRAVPARESAGAIEVEHPRFAVLPRLEALSGAGYCAGLLRPLLRRRAGIDLLHVHCAYPDAVGAAAAARLLGLPYLVTVHGSDVNVYAQRRTLRPQIAWALRHAAGIVAVSPALQERVRELTAPFAPPTACIPCAGFDGRVFRPQRIPAAEAQEAAPRAPGRVVLFVGRLDPIKCVDRLIEAWALLRARGALSAPDRLVIIGDGPCRPALERLGAGAPVRFTGSIAQGEVADWVARAAALCLPSRNEGTPNVVVEALACGVPVVASRVGGIPQLVRDGVNGLLAAPGDAAALADALAAALARTWDARRIAESVAHLTWPELARRNLEFIDSLALEARHASLA